MEISTKLTHGSWGHVLASCLNLLSTCMLSLFLVLWPFFCGGVRFVEDNMNMFLIFVVRWSLEFPFLVFQGAQDVLHSHHPWHGKSTNDSLFPSKPRKTGVGRMPSFGILGSLWDDGLPGQWCQKTQTTHWYSSYIYMRKESPAFRNWVVLVCLDCCWIK